jgi:hypothetical protein
VAPRSQRVLAANHCVAIQVRHMRQQLK